ncbi:MAG: hypothetical protein OXF24_03850 [Hyphomicrobiales bacterium]|nr:hypothetical protein [Hyphomicrobiales bacterium]
MVPATLQEVVTYLKSQILVLPSGSGDARTDSTFAEGYIIQKIREAGKWDVYSPHKDRKNNRAWYDVKIDGLYCDIKVSMCKGNDNTQAKKAIYYLLTGDEETEKIPDRGDEFFRLMYKNESPNETRDYYYLIVNKTNTRDVFVVNLKGIAKCSVAPANMPFQVNWGKNRELVERTWEEAKNYLLGAWAESVKRLIKLKAKGMPEYYPQFFDEQDFKKAPLE